MTKMTKDEYINTHINQDVKNTPKRTLYDLVELGNLISDQYDDMKTFNIKQEKLCLTTLNRI